MVKNSKMLKGAIIALALVLVLVGGILLKAAVDAAAKTVVFYVSDAGDDTTGTDVASAFTTIGSALKKANEMKLDPGMKLRLVVADTVSIPTQYLDNQIIAKDKEGGKLPVTVTSLEDDSDDNMSTIYLTYVQANGAYEDGSQRAYVTNDFTFKDIAIKAKVHGNYVANNNTGKMNNLYRIRYFRIVNSNVTFDNCHLTSDLGDFCDGTPTWYIYGDNMTASNEKRDTVLTIKNRDLSHVMVHLVSDGSALCPNYSAYFYGENTALGEFYIMRRTATAKTQDLQKAEVNFKNCTLGNLYLSSSGGDLEVPGGVTVNAENTEVLKMAGSSGTPIVRANVTYNFEDSIIHGHTSLDKLAFFAPKGELYGDVAVNLKDTDLSVTADSIYSIGNGGVIHGDAYTNVSGNTKFNRFVGGDNSNKGVIKGTIYTTFEGNPTVKGNFFGGNYTGGSIKAIYNTIKSGDFMQNLYFGTRFGVVTNNITNDISGGKFDNAGWLYLGNNQGTFGKPTEKIDYRIRNIVSNISVNRYCGGSGATKTVIDTENHGEFANGTIENYLSGNLEFKTACYPGGGANDVSVVKNVFSGTIKGATVFVCGGCNGANVGEIYNIVENGADIHNLNAGNNGGGRIGSITNVINGGTLTGFVGGGRGNTANIGTIKNFFNGGAIVPGTAKLPFYGGNVAPVSGSNVPKVENIENTFAGTDLSGVANVICGSRAGTVNNSVTNLINGAGKAHGTDYFICGNDSATFGTPTKEISYRVKNVISNASFKRFMGGSNSAAITGEGALGTVENHFGNGIAIGTSCYGGANGGKTTTVNNLFTGKITGAFVCGAANGGTVDYVSNIVESGADIPNLYAGNNGTGAIKSIVNLMNGGKIGTFYCGGKNTGASIDSIRNYLYGGSITANAYGTGVGGTVKSVENHLYGTEIKNYYGGSSDASTITSLKNHYNGGKITGTSFGGGATGTVGSIVNVFENTTFSGGTLYGGNKAGTITGNITNVLGGGKTYGTEWFIGGNNTATFAALPAGSTLTYRIKNVIDNANFKRFVGGSDAANVPGVIENHVGDAKFTTIFYGGATNSKTANTIKNTFDGVITPDGAVVCGGNNAGNSTAVYNTIEEGAVIPYFYGGNNSTGTIGTIVNVVNGGTFKGSSTGAAGYAGGGRSGNVGTIKNTIKGGTFNGNVFMGGFGSCTVTGGIESVISGGTFKSLFVEPISQQNNTSLSASNTSLFIRPDDSSEKLFFDFAPNGTNFSGVSNPGAANVQIDGGMKPIYIGSNARICADRVKGGTQATLIQEESWVDGKAYVVLAGDAAASVSLIKLVNAEGVTGSATHVAKNEMYAYPNQSATNRQCLVGDVDATATTVVPAAPTLAGVGVSLTTEPQLNLYVAKDSVEKQIAVFGKFTYKVSFMGNVLTSGEITNISQATVEGSNVKISLAFDVPATKYGEAATVTLCGNAKNCTVYQLLELAIDAAATSKEENFIKSLYNYGVEAEKLTGSATADTYYDGIRFAGNYDFDATAVTKLDGFAFTKAGISLDGSFYLDFYLKAASVQNLTFKAELGGVALPADCIKVKNVAGEDLYNVVVSVKLDVLSADQDVTLTALSGGVEAAISTNSITSTCAHYLSVAKYEKVATALLTYFEKALEYKA